MPLLLSFCWGAVLNMEEGWTFGEWLRHDIPTLTPQISVSPNMLLHFPRVFLEELFI